MKKRYMKKYIPKDTDYCYERIKPNKNSKFKTNITCKNLIFVGYKKDCLIIPSKDNSGLEEHPVQIRVYKCRYTNETTWDDCVLADMCKICGEKYSKDEY